MRKMWVAGVTYFVFVACFVEVTLATPDGEEWKEEVSVTGCACGGLGEVMRRSRMGSNSCQVKASVLTGHTVAVQAFTIVTRIRSDTITCFVVV